MGNIILFEDLKGKRNAFQKKVKHHNYTNLFFTIEFTRDEMAVLKKVFKDYVNPDPINTRKDFPYIMSYNIKAFEKGLQEIKGVRNGKYEILLHAYELFYFEQSIKHALGKRRKEFGIRQRETLKKLRDKLEVYQEKYKDQVEEFFNVSFTDKYDVMANIWGSAIKKKGT